MFKTIVIETHFVEKSKTMEIGMDAKQLSNIANAVDKVSIDLLNEGYKVISITPITGSDWSAGTRMTHTSAIFITGQRIDSL